MKIETGRVDLLGFLNVRFLLDILDLLEILIFERFCVVVLASGCFVLVFERFCVLALASGCLFSAFWPLLWASIASGGFFQVNMYLSRGIFDFWMCFRQNMEASILYREHQGTGHENALSAFFSKQLALKLDPRAAKWNFNPNVFYQIRARPKPWF